MIKKKENISIIKNKKSKKIKILYFISGLGFGGAERQLYYLLSNLSKKKDIQIEVFSLGNGPYFKKIKDLGIKVHLSKKKQSLKNVFTYISELKKILKNFEPDIVHSFLFHTNIILKFALINIKKEFKIICSYRSLVSKLPTIRKLERFNMNKADLLISNSILAKKDLDKYYPKFKNRTIAINNGLEMRKVNKKKLEELKTKYKGKKIITTIGRFSPEKDYETNMKVCLELSKKRNDFLFLYVGDEDYSIQKEKAKELGINKYIKFVGKIDYVFELLKISDVFFLPTKFESQCNAIMDAAYMKTPIVTTNIPANKYLVQEGFLCKIGAHTIMTEKINEILTNGFDEFKLDKNKEFISNNFSISNMGEKYYKEYLNLIN